MSKPIENIVATQGLSSVTSINNEDYNIWYNQYKDVLDTLKVPEVHRLFKDVLFIDKFGEEAYNKAISNPEYRDNVYESTVLTDYINANYQEDPRLNDILTLSNEGKRYLINADNYYSPAQIEAEKIANEKIRQDATITLDDDTNWFVKAIMNAPVDDGVKISNKDFMNQSTNTIIESHEQTRENIQNKVLNQIIEEDKDRQIENTEGAFINLRSAYQNALNDGSVTETEINEEFKKIAEGYTETIDTPDGVQEVNIPGSNYYNVFKDSTWLENFSFNQKLDLLCRYRAIMNEYGFTNAQYYLDSTIQEYIAEQQGFWTTTGKTINKITTTGIIPDLWNTVVSIPTFFMEEEEAVNYLNGIDENGNELPAWKNPQYLDKVSRYGTWDKDLIAEADANGGISQRNTVWTKDQENAWLSNKTFADVAEQTKWMIELAATSYATGGVGSLFQKGLSYTTKGLKAINTGRKIGKVLDTTEDILSGLGRITKMGLDAAPISTMEARGVFNETRDANRAKIDSMIEAQAVDNATQQLQSPEARQSIETMANHYLEEFKRNNPKVKPEDIDYNDFIQLAEERYKTYLIESNKEAIVPSYAEDREVADQMALDAFKTTFALSTIKTSAVNMGFRSYLNTLSFRKAVNAPTPKIKTRIGANGLMETVPVSNYSRYVQPFLKNTFGEGIDEVADEVIAAFGRGAGTTSFNTYYSNKYEETDLNTFWSGLLGGIAGATSSLTEEQTWKAGFLGAISGVTNISPQFRMAQIKPINGEKYTFLEYINKFVSNPIINDIVESRAEEYHTKQRVEAINSILKNYSSSFTDINGILSSIAGKDNALQLGNIEHAYNYKHDSAVNLMMTLEHLANDGVASSSEVLVNTRQMLERAAKGEITEEEIQTFIGSVNNRGKSISTEEAKTSIQENAQKLLEIEEQIKRTRNQLSNNSNFTNLSVEEQDNIVRNVLKIEDYERRISSIRKNLGLSSSTTTAVVAGSSEDIELQIDALFKEISDLVDIRSEIRESSKKEDKIILKEIRKKTLDILEKKIKNLRNFSVNEEGFTETLSAEQIKALDEESLAYILNPDNLKYFSEEQQEIIKEVKEKLAENIASSELYNDSVENYINTLASLKEAVETGSRINKALLVNGLNGKKLANFYKTLSLNKKLNRNGINKQVIFSSFDDYVFTPEGKFITDQESIQSMLYNLILKDPRMLKQYIEERSRNYPTKIKEALEKALNKSELLSEIQEALEGIEMSEDIRKNIVNASINIVAQSEVTYLKEVLEALSSITSINEELNNAFNQLLENLGIVIENKETRERIEEPIMSDDKSGEVVTPPAPIDVKVTEDEEQIERSKITDPVYEVTEEGGEKIVSEKPNESIQIANNVINNISRFSEEVKKKAREILEYASESSTAQELADYLNAEANRLDALSTEEGDFNTSDLLRQCAVRVINASQNQAETEEKQKKESGNIFDRNRQLVSTMESVDMDDIVKRYPDGPLSKFYIKYKVRDFLTTGTISNNTPVVFITDPNLTREVEESMKNSGLNYTINSMPIIAAVEVGSGGITIGDKHYQPIAIMPATDNYTKQGTARLSEIRKLAYIQSNETAQLVKTEDGTVITTSISGTVNADKLPHLPMTEPNRSVQTLQINDLQESERREISNMSKSERRKHPIYQRIKNYFLSRLKRIEKGKEEILVYELDNLKGEKIPYQAFITPSHKTVDRNSDRLIVDLLKENNRSALRSNSRIIRYLYELNRFFSSTFNTEEFAFDQDENGNIVPNDKTRSTLETHASKLDSILGNFLNLPTREGWHYQLTPIRLSPGGKVEVSLSLINNNGNTINLGNITEGSISEDTQFDIIKNLFIDSSTREVRMRDSKNAFVIWNVKYSDSGNSEYNAKNNIADIYDDDIIEFSKSSLQYSVRGVTINAPFTLDGRLKPFTPDTRKNQGTSTEQQVEEKVEQETPAIEIQQGGTVVEGNSVFDSNTGIVIEGEVKQPNEVQASKEEIKQEQESSEQVEQKEAKPIRRLRDRRIKSTKPTLPQQSANPKYTWGKFEGAKMSVQEITEALNAQQIFTEEDWNSRTEQEKERVLKCCGAI